jgi:hypothetical protein
MGFIYILLVMLILLFGTAYYGYQAGYYTVGRFGGGLFVIVVVLLIFFMLARPN